MRYFKKQKPYPLFFLLSFLAFLSACTTRKQEKPKAYLSLNEAKEDFHILTAHIEKDVPHPYYNCPQSNYDSVKQVVDKSLHDSMTTLELYRTLYPLMQTG